MFLTSSRGASENWPGSVTNGMNLTHEQTSKDHLGYEENQQPERGVAFVKERESVQETERNFSRVHHYPQKDLRGEIIHKGSRRLPTPPGWRLHAAHSSHSQVSSSKLP